jgi:uncharacterized protein (TIGR00369 family)
MVTDPQELQALGRALGAVQGGLDDRMGIEFLEASADRVVARMPVEGNTQVYGTLHGGASCVLAESIGSCAAAVHAGPGRMALGIELNVTHHRVARSGYVTGVATKAYAGSNLATYDIVITDERDRRICTARVTSTLRDRAADPDPRTTAAIELLTARGTGEIAHPGGTLLAHLRRVHRLVEQWGARPAVRLAALCHAFYGTDGFATALGEVTRRDDLSAIIGEEAERLVYFYAACDRAFSYPRLTDADGGFKNRFTGTVWCPPPRLRRDFAEITVANELDIAIADPDFRARYGRELLDQFTPWQELLSDPAWQAVRRVLPDR